MPSTKELMVAHRALARLDVYVRTLRALMQEDEPIRRMAVWSELSDEFLADETAKEFAEG